MAETKKDAPKAETKTTKDALGEDWQLVHESEGYLIAERYVQSLGMQKVSESGVDMADLQAKTKAYDDHLAAVEEGRKAELEAAPAPQTTESVDADALAAEESAA